LEFKFILLNNPPRFYGYVCYYVEGPPKSKESRPAAAAFGYTYGYG